MIPYPANQNPQEKDFLRVDKHFRTYGPSRLNLENHKARGLRNILAHALLCIIAMLLVALTALRLEQLI